MDRHPELDQITDTRLRRAVDQIIEYEIKRERERCIAALVAEQPLEEFDAEYLGLIFDNYRG